jgi:hypothetical protein
MVVTNMAQVALFIPASATKAQKRLFLDWKAGYLSWPLMHKWNGMLLGVLTDCNPEQRKSSGSWSDGEDDLGSCVGSGVDDDG